MGHQVGYTFKTACTFVSAGLLCVYAWGWGAWPMEMYSTTSVQTLLSVEDDADNVDKDDNKNVDKDDRQLTLCY